MDKSETPDDPDAPTDTEADGQLAKEIVDELTHDAEEDGFKEGSGFREHEEDSEDEQHDNDGGQSIEEM